MYKLSKLERHDIINNIKTIIEVLDSHNTDKESDVYDDVQHVTSGLRIKLDNLRAINSKVEGL